MKLFLSLFLASSVMLHAADPEVSNLSASQRNGTKLVDISYDVAADTATVSTSLRISSDSGATFDVPAVTLSGDIGADITVGTGKSITWDAGTDWDEQFSETMRFELTADDGQVAVPEGMVAVEGGTLAMSMGTLSVDTFYIGRHEVTWGEWQAVRSWAAGNSYDIGSRGAGCANDHPVHSVAWYDVVKWCNAKSEMEGLTPVYSYNGSTYRIGEPSHTLISQNLSANGYRLPQEAEWEFAARGGNQTNGYTYAGSNDLNAVGWYFSNSGGAACGSNGTWPVGQKAANELGLYDMSGNVWEWCWDQDNTYRHVRGGSWFNEPNWCVVSQRSVNTPDGRVSDRGFRLARSIP